MAIRKAGKKTSNKGSAVKPTAKGGKNTAAAMPASSQDVWYRLMKLGNLVNRPFFSLEARLYHISINEWRIIMTLAYLGETAAHELADASGLHPMNVSRSLALLRRQGRVEVRVDPDNRRRKLFRLTLSGKTLHREISPHMKKRADQLFDLLTERQIDQFGRTIDQLILGLQKISEQ